MATRAGVPSRTAKVSTHRKDISGLGSGVAKSVAKHHGPIPASQAKTHLLALIKQVNADRTPITITKRGKPVARLVFAEEQPSLDIFGCMKGSGSISGDILSPEPDIWEAASK